MEAKETISKIMSRLDGWLNVLTGFGIRGRDKRMSHLPQTCFLGQGIVEALYQSDDIAARIIDRIPEEMMREGYLILTPEKPEYGQVAMERLKEFQINEKTLTAMKEARLYGQAGILVGVENQEPFEPLNFKQISSIKFFVSLSRYILQVQGSDLERDPANKNFGKPNFYSVSSEQVRPEDNLQKIHHSRFGFFHGVELPYNLLVNNNYWSDSVLSRIMNVIRNYNSSHDAMATLMQDLAQAVIKINNLSDLIGSGKHELVSKRLEMATLVNSACNALILDKDEDYERKTTSVAGATEILEKIANRLVAATDYPHTILLGESPTASNATGNSTTMAFYDYIKSQQETVLKPILRWILDIIFSDKSWVTRGEIPKYEIVFNPLWQLDLKEQAEVKKIIAEADGSYIDRAVLMPEEVRKSRFGGREFSIETQLDDELLKELES